MWEDSNFHMVYLYILENIFLIQFSSVQLLSCVWLFATPWTAECQASLSLSAPRAQPNPCPSSQWCHPTISSSVIPFSFCPQSFPTSGTFQMSQLFTWSGPSMSFSFSMSPSNEHLGLISFRMDWLDPLAAQENLEESPPTPQFKSINSSVLSFLYIPTLIHTWLLEKP